MMKKNFKVHESLVNKCLVASNSLNGSFFEKTVIYICAHDDDGAVGVIVNKVEKICSVHALRNIINPMQIPPGRSEIKVPLYIGGPMNESNYYVLSEDYVFEAPEYENTLNIFTDFKEVIFESLNNDPQQPFLLMKGFCSWGPGQIEGEIKEGSWFVKEIDRENIFLQKNLAQFWKKQIKGLGIKNSCNLVNYSGNA